MAFGDIGGPVTELVITCRTKSEGPVDIKKGDAVSLCGNYEITNDESWADVFGQALASATTNDTAIPIRVKGVSVYTLATFPAKYLYGKSVLTAPEPGKVFVCFPKNNTLIVSASPESSEVHVLH